MASRLAKLLFPILTGALMLGLWYARHATLPEDSQFLLPTPGAVLRAVHDNRDIMLRATLNTSKGALLGFALAVGVSSLTALLLSLSSWIRAGLYPYLMMLQ